MFKRFLAFTLAFAFFATTWLMPTSATTRAVTPAEPTLKDSILFDVDYTTGSLEEKTGNFDFYASRDPANFPITEHAGILSTMTSTTGSIAYTGSEITLDETFTYEYYFWSDNTADCLTFMTAGGTALEYDQNTGFGFYNDDVAVQGTADNTQYAGKWTHVVATVDNGIAKVYLNGEFLYSGAFDDVVTANRVDVGFVGAGTQYHVALARIYGDAATAEDAKDLYRACPETPQLEDSVLFNADYTTGSLDEQTGNFDFYASRDPANFPITEHAGILSTMTSTTGSIAYTGSEITLDETFTYEYYFWSDNTADCLTFMTAGGTALEYDQNTGFGFYNDDVAVQGTADNTQYAGKWTHVVATVDNGIAKVYLNGEFLYSGAFDDVATANRVDVGFVGAGTQYHVALARIYDDAATAAEVAALYAARPQEATPAPTEAPTPVPTEEPKLEDSLVFDADFRNQTHVDGKGNFTFGRPDDSFVMEKDPILGEYYTGTDGSEGGMKYTGDYDFGDSITVETYFLSNNTDACHVFWKATGDTRTYLEFDQGGGFGFYNWNDSLVQQGEGNNSIYLGKWTHLVAVLGNGTATIYVNGEVVATGEYADPINATRFDIGVNDEGAIDFKMMYTKVYDDAATAAEVAALYAARPQEATPAPTEVPTPVPTEAPTPAPTARPTLDETLVFDADYTTGSHADKTGNFNFDRTPGDYPILDHAGLLSTTTTGSSLKYTTGSAISLGDTVTFEVYFFAAEMDDWITLLEFNQTLHFELDPGSGVGLVEKDNWSGIYEYPEGGAPIANYLGKWMHVVGVVEEGTVTIYVNGEELLSGEISGTFAGTRVDAGFINGTKSYNVAFARIYDLAANETEVASLYAARPTPATPAPTEAPTPAPTARPTLDETLVFDADYTTGSHADKTGNFNFDRTPGDYPILDHAGLLSTTTTGSSLKYTTGSAISLGDTVTFEVYFFAAEMDDWITLLEFNQTLHFELDPGSGFGLVEKDNWSGIYEYPEGGAPIANYLGKWMHVVGVVEEGTVTIYVNGEELLSGELSGTFEGTRVDAGFINGTKSYNVAFARIYDLAANETEVASLYAARPMPTETTPTPTTEPTPTPSLELAEGEDQFVLADGILTGVRDRLSPADVIARFANSANVVVVKADGSALAAGEFVGTGCLVRLMDGETVLEEVQVIVKGDVDGNGKITTTDYLRIREAFGNRFEFDELAFKAADVDGNGKLTTTDYLRIRHAFAGTFDLYKAQ